MPTIKNAFFLAKVFLLIFIITGINGCKVSENKSSAAEGGEEVEVVFLHINDVYEIAPLEGGKVGGMARVATLNKILTKQNPNTFAILAGDFLSPSIFNFIKYNGERIKGKQMVEVMNAAGMDLVTFGNHEFDLKEEELQQRINESDFMWMSSNVLQQKGNIKNPFQKQMDTGDFALPETIIIDAVSKKGKAVRVGIIGVTLPMNQVDYVFYEDIYEAAKEAYDSLSKKADVVVALTHLNIEQDRELAQRIPGLKLLMGGHDHDNMYETVGTTAIAKADANAKTAYVHRLKINTNTKETTLTSELKAVDESIALDDSTQQLVDHWMDIAIKSFKEQGFDYDEVIYTSIVPLEGKESIIRNQPTNLGSMIAAALYEAAENADAAILNAGSVRIDDQLSGAITQYDILRTLPFGGSIIEVEMKGAILKKVLETGLNNKGTGGFLHWHNIRHDSRMNTWSINGKAIEDDKSYIIAMPEFLISGMEKDMDFLNRENPGIIKINEPKTGENNIRSDIRKGVIEYLKNL